MYRNIAYLSREGIVRLFTWNEDGERVSYDVPYRPYLYVETGIKRRDDKISLFNTRLRKKEFGNEYRRREYINNLRRQSGDSETVRIFESISTLQQFLVDTYWQENDKPEFTANPIKVVFLDIETYSPDAFPTPDKASDTVNVITVYDTLVKKFYTWGLGPYKPKRDDVVYKQCVSERELLLCFVEYIEADHPDVLTGWNSELFDIPYLVNRITKILGEDVAKRLSPVRVIYNRELVSQFGRYNTRWHFKGVSCVDYLDVYKKFSQGLRESYKLNDIGEHELKEKKVDFGDMNLATLADKDWQTFVDYNIQDVNLLVKMEKKLQYLELLRMLAYVGLTPFENAMGTLNVITGASVVEARKNNLVIPTFIEKRDTSKYEGAYVGEPKRGFQDYVVSFDVNSLYPNIMISLNLSPETKMGRFELVDDGVIIHKAKGNPVTLDKKTFVKTVKDLNLSLSRANILFSQKRQGIFPKIVDSFYKERVKIISRMNKYKRLISEMSTDDEKYTQLSDEINRLHIKQFTIKIFINTVYGYFGNKHAPMGDSDISRSITLTGQAVIKQSNKILIEYIQKKCALTDDQIAKDTPIIYNDTDSVYITIKHIINKLGIPFTTKTGKVTKDVRKIVDDIEKYLNEEIAKWGKAVLNSSDCRLQFKRESICDVGVFLQKKRYILHILDDEGISVNKFKYTGVEVVRTTMPKAIKPYVKKIIETMLLTKDFNKTNEMLNEAYDIFKKLSIQDIAFVMGISKYKTESRDDYGNIKDKCEGFKTYKGMPIHVKSAYHYNLLLDRYGLTNKYETIGSGDKVRYFYVKQPNKYGIKSIAYKYYYPKEFENDLVPDTELMFDKIIYSAIERLYESVNWKPRKPGEMVQTDLFELLGNNK